MSDFSKSPRETLIENQQKGYVGIHIEQGVPVLDRDLNLLHDLIAAAVRSVIARYIGNGIAIGMDEDRFCIQAIPANNDFRIRNGTCLVGGLEITIPADINYSGQAGIPALTTPQAAQPDPRQDIVYLDMGLTEVDGTTDSDLRNTADVGMQTSTREKVVWVVRVAEDAPSPPPPEPGHTHFSLAQLQRPRGNASINATMITDLRQIKLTLSDAEQRLQLLEKLVLVPAFNPSPNQFDPKFGQPGTEVTLFGKNFDIGIRSIRFGTVPIPANDIGKPDPAKVVVKVPSMPQGDVHITVETIGGSDISEDLFTVLPPPAPTFRASPNQFEPKFGPPGTPVTLFGNNFNVGTVSVRFGTRSATIVGTPSASQIATTVPAMTTGPIKITVQTGGGSRTSDDDFTVTT